MKILCDRQQLQEAFHVVGATAPTKTTRNILQHVMLRASGEELTLFATDEELSARMEITGVKVKQEGSMLLPARETMALLKELQHPTVSLERSEFRCNLESGTDSFVLLGDDPDQFPSEPKLEESTVLKIPSVRFLEMVQQTAFAAAREETRYAINGVLVERTDGRLRLVATDGRRLAMTFEPDDGQDEAVRVIAPLRSLQTLSRALGDGTDDDLLLHVGTHQIAFQCGRMEWISQLLDTTFPEYEGVIPKSAESTIEIPRVDLERALRKVAIMSRGDVRLVRFDFTPDGLKLSAESSDVGRADVSIDVQLKGAGGPINFNPDFVLEALRATERDVVRLDMTDDATPAKFTLDEAFTYVLMPISGS